VESVRPWKKNSGLANFCVSRQGIIRWCVYTSTRSQAGQDQSPLPVLGFGRQHAIRKHRCQHWGVCSGLEVDVWQTDAAILRQPGSRGMG